MSAAAKIILIAGTLLTAVLCINYANRMQTVRSYAEQCCTDALDTEARLRAELHAARAANEELIRYCAQPVGGMTDSPKGVW